MTITIPMPPPLNHLYPEIRGRRRLSEVGVNFKNEVGKIVLQHYKAARVFRDNPAEPLRFMAVVYFKRQNLRRSDLDGRLKIMQDAVCEALGVNDKWVDHIVLLRKPTDGDESVTVTIFHMEAV